MFGLTGAAKWIAIASIVGTIGLGLNAVRIYHNNQIEAAVETAKLVILVEQTELQQTMQKILRDKALRNKAQIEIELKVERQKVTDLRRMLLIDHDLDRLLQRKPGLILTRVNKGTEEYLLELERLTQ